MRPVALVVNPAAGGGRARAAAAQVAAALRPATDALDVVETRGLDHATQAAAEAARSGALVVALGGDGLVGPVAGAVAAADGLFAALPGGRGNDFVRNLGLPLDPVAAARALPACVERRVDLGLAGDRPFVGIASVGFDGEANRVANATTVLRGRLVYAYATVRVLASWRPARFCVRIDDAPYDYTGYMVTVANTTSYGGGMRVAPHADLADGRLDVIMTAAMPRLRFLLAAPRVYTGRHLEQPAVHEGRGRVVRVEADRPFPVYADGDPVGTLPMTFTVRPAALRVLAPA